MPITSGAVIVSKLKNKSFENITKVSSQNMCELCFQIIEEKPISCLNIVCDLMCHITCLANISLDLGEYVPVEGKCPKCDEQFVWGDIIKKYKGYGNNADITINLDAEFEFNDSE